MPTHRVPLILNIEDDEPTRYLYSRLLRKAGFVVCEAATGAEALAVAAAERPDLVLLDINLPDVNGFEVCRQLRSLPALARTPVVHLSALARAEADVVRGLECGADAYLTKPVAPDVLLAHVRALLQGRQAEEARRRSEGLFRLVWDSSADGMRLTDEQGTVRQANEAYCRLVGLPREQVEGQPLSAAYVPDRREHVLRAHQERFADRAVESHQEAEVTLWDGRKAWFEVSSSFLEIEETPPLLLSIFRDVTQRKQLEAERDHVLGQMKLQVERLPLPHLLTDAEFRYTGWNPAAERTFGYRRDEVLGKHPFDLIVPAASRALVEEVFARLRAGDMAAHGVCENVTRDGRTIICQWHNTPLLAADGSFLGLLSLAQDITEQRLLEERLRQSQKLEAIGRLAGGVAHDFNNLLTIINGFSEVLLGRFAPEDPAHQFAREIHRAGERAASLTQQLLAYGRKQILSPRVLDFNAQITDMERLLRRTLGEDIEIVLDLEPGLGQVQADPGQLQQVLLNLVVNAREAMPTGGCLSIRTANRTLDEKAAAAMPEAQPGSYVVLSVADTGAGMDEATRDRLFEPFFTTKEFGKGTGLGLATVYGIVRQSGGHITVDSAPGKGTTFTILLPHAPEAQAGAAAAAAASRGGSETLLLVEDDAGVRGLARMTLTTQGYTVLEAREGAEALQLSASHPGAIHLLITDVVMPRMSGRELAERLRLVRPGVKVLYMSGHTDDSVLRHGVEQARTNFIPKPFSPAHLTRRVRDILDNEGFRTD